MGWDSSAKQHRSRQIGQTGAGVRSAVELRVRGQGSKFSSLGVSVLHSPPAGATALLLAAAVEADDHAPSVQVGEAPGQVGVKTLKTRTESVDRGWGGDKKWVGG